MRATRRRRVVRRIVWTLVVLLVLALLPFAVVQLVGQTKVAGSIDAVEARPYVIVPGAGLRPGNRPSVYLERRLQAALDLYDAGKAERILVSGDASTPYHDEPAAMLAWLVDHGVPADAVVTDGSGLDTHDTCVRARDVHGIESAIVVTQDYHLRRMLFSCTAAGIDVEGIGVSAQSVTPAQAVMWRLRELPASWKAFVDGAVDRPPAHRD